MKKLLLLLSILLVANTFTSCKKEKEEKPAPTKTELLTAHEWIGIDRIKYENDVEVNSDDMSDYTMLFAINNDLFIYNNGTPSEFYSWEYIKGNPDIIRLSDMVTTSHNPMLYLSQANKNTYDTYDWEVDELTENKLTFTMIFPSNPTEKYVFHFKK